MGKVEEFFDAVLLSATLALLLLNALDALIEVVLGGGTLGRVLALFLECLLRVNELFLVILIFILVFLVLSLFLGLVLGLVLGLGLLLFLVSILSPHTQGIICALDEVPL